MGVLGLAGIMVEPLFNAFATAAFFEFVTFAIFEMRYLLSIWRARRSSSLDAWAAQVGRSQGFSQVKHTGPEHTVE